MDESGRVLVADRGNSRLVVLGFDGTDFSYLDSFSAGFNTSTGVAVDALGNIAVAGTGNRRVATVRGALPGCKTWLPLTLTP